MPRSTERSMVHEHTEWTQMRATKRTLGSNALVMIFSNGIVRILSVVQLSEKKIGSQGKLIPTSHAHPIVSSRGR